MTGTGSEESLLGKIAGYTEALVRDPRSTVFVPLSEAYRKMGLVDDAVAVARQGVARVPGFVPGYIALGRALGQQGAHSEAAVAFEQALQIESDNLLAVTGLARVLLLQGEKEQARRLLQTARKLAPDDPQLGKMLASLGPEPQRVSAAVSPAAGPPVKGAETPIATATVAEIYIRQGLYPKAMKIYRDLLQVDGNNPGLLQKMAELHRLMTGGAESEVAAAAPSPSVAPVAGPAPETVSAPVSAPSQTSTPEVSPRTDLATFERWLAAIRRRRADV